MIRVWIGFQYDVGCDYQVNCGLTTPIIELCYECGYLVVHY